MPKGTSPSVLDLFAGVGGMSLGFEQAGFEVVFANEYDEEIASSYVRNHPKAKMVVGDIRDLDIPKTFGALAGKVDVVIGGPPCQGFSQKGSRRTIHDDRNFLFRNFVAVVEYLKPTYFVMENVPNLLTSEHGLFKRELIELFESLGYAVTAEVLNAADFGVPQNRRRAIIIGKKGVVGLKHPIPTGEEVTVWDAISDLNFLESGEGSSLSDYLLSPSSSYQKVMRAGSKKLRNHQATRHSNVAIERMMMVPPNCTEKVLPEEHRTKSIYSGTWTRLDSAGKSPTITTRFDTPSSGQFTHPYLHRALTVREAARIQSFPDSFEFIGTKMSQMRQVGNAVPPKLARSIAEVLIEDLEGGSE